MTDHDEHPPEVLAAVDELQRDIDAAVEMMADTFSLAESEEMIWPKGSVERIAFDAGVAAGSAAAAAVFMQRGWLTIPPPASTGGDE